ncbi:MAG: ArsB/NhaD family transporter, partial [Candidatus Cloacimonas sp.]|nr:hypothetical protein [Candidatus Cloacimonadota bacterium]
GYIDKIAAYYSQVAHTEAKGIFFSGVGSIILANIINNQPMSIFLSRVFTNTQIALNESVVQASAYATIISSNLGANITLIGALAGLMWKRILDVKKVKITYASFFRIGIIVTPITALLTFITLYFMLN